MTIDYYISMGSMIVGSFGDIPALKAVPTALRATASFFPQLFPLGISKKLTDQEQEKLDKIKILAHNISQDLGINGSTKINLRVSSQLGANACMVGTTSSFGGPLLCLGETYFKNYEPLPNADDSDFSEWLKILDETPAEGDELDKYNQSCTQEKQARIEELAEKFKGISIIKDPQFREWITTLNEIPNTPSDLGKYLDRCTNEKRHRIKQLAGKFKDVLSQEEFESILAHELGHAKHHHLLKSAGVIGIFFTLEKVARISLKLFGPEGFSELISWASIPLQYLTIKAISRSHESEADGECASAKKYKRGMLTFHKKELINDLFEETSSLFKANKIDEMENEVEWTSSHPNSAKRMEHAAQVLEKPNQSKTVMTKAGWALTALGVIAISKSCFLNGVNLGVLPDFAKGGLAWFASRIFL